LQAGGKVRTRILGHGLFKYHRRCVQLTTVHGGQHKHMGHGASARTFTTSRCDHTERDALWETKDGGQPGEFAAFRTIFSWVSVFKNRSESSFICTAVSGGIGEKSIQILTFNLGVFTRSYNRKVLEKTIRPFKNWGCSHLFEMLRDLKGIHHSRFNKYYPAMRQYKQ
jgi:hypothetical protein